jgi:hypothetical protein
MNIQLSTQCDQKNYKDKRHLNIGMHIADWLMKSI